MCGIAGLFLKDRAMAPDIGALLSGMMVSLGDRGPDSAGFAIYGAGLEGCIKLTLRLAQIADAELVIERLNAALGVKIVHRLHDTHMVIAVPLEREMEVRAELEGMPWVALVGAGRRMELFKES